MGGSATWNHTCFQSCNINPCSHGWSLITPGLRDTGEQFLRTFLVRHGPGGVANQCHQGIPTWVGSKIIPISPMEPTPGTPWERKVWNDHSPFGLPYLNPDADLSRRWGEPPASHLGCWSGVRQSHRVPNSLWRNGSHPFFE